MPRLDDELARLRDAALDLGLSAVHDWTADAFSAAMHEGELPRYGITGAARELADALVELQQLRAKVADLHNILTPLVAASDELNRYIDEHSIGRAISSWQAFDEVVEAFGIVIGPMGGLDERWKAHREQHGKGNEIEGQRTQARERVQGQGQGQGGAF